ncbi:MAG: hypothetical protein Q9162_006169 [Coniocarpon cinnabarinum]
MGEMARETRTIEMSLRSIEATLKSSGFRTAEARLETNPDNAREALELREAMMGSLSDCQTTLLAVADVITPLLPPKPNWFEQAARQARLSLKQPELSPLYQQLRGHRGAMQLTMQMITLRASYMAPGYVVDELSPKIEELRKLMDKSELRDEELRTLGLSKNEDNSVRLRLSAEKVISSATTVSGRSEVETSIMGDKALNETRRRGLQSWIEANDYAQIPMEDILEPHATNSTRSTSFQEPFDFSDTRTVPTAPTEPTSTAGEEPEIDSDSDEKLQSELVDNLVRKGNASYKQQDFGRAHQYFKDSLKEAKELPVRLRNRSNLEDARLKLATCYIYSGEIGQAEASLRAIADDHHRKSIRESDQLNDDQQASRLCEASYLLAVVLYRLGEFVEARSYCRKSIIGRQRTVGKRHTTVYQSYLLMVQIYEAEENSSVASIFQEWIPDSVRPQLKRVEEQFPPVDTLSTVYTSPVKAGSLMEGSDRPQQQQRERPPFSVSNGQVQPYQRESLSLGTSLPNSSPLQYGLPPSELPGPPFAQLAFSPSQHSPTLDEFAVAARPLSVSTVHTDQVHHLTRSSTTCSPTDVTTTSPDGGKRRRSSFFGLFNRKTSAPSDRMNIPRKDPESRFAQGLVSGICPVDEDTAGSIRAGSQRSNSSPAAPGHGQNHDPSFVEYVRQLGLEEDGSLEAGKLKPPVEWPGLF